MRYLILSLTILFLLISNSSSSEKLDCYKIDELIYRDMKEISKDDKINYVELHKDKIILVMNGTVSILNLEGEDNDKPTKNGSKGSEKIKKD